MAVWPVPRTWATGETVTAAMMNGLRDELLYLHGDGGGVIDYAKPTLLGLDRAAGGIFSDAGLLFKLDGVIKSHLGIENDGTVRSEAGLILGAALTTPGVHVGTNDVVVGPGAGKWGMARGHTTGVTVGPNPATYGPVPFGITFAAAPMVWFSGTFAGQGPANITVTTTQFTMTNQGNGTDGVDTNWFAFGLLP
jgi:hypothetical protein